MASKKPPPAKLTKKKSGVEKVDASQVKPKNLLFHSFYLIKKLKFFYQRQNF
jgi:hypothetical protein